jgi:opacity protein-like surface antigen
MKTVTAFLLIILTMAVATTASAKVRGWGIGAGVLDGDFGLQARKDFFLGGDISQITGQASVYFHNKTTFRVDADYHFLIKAGEPSRFYPLAGLQLAFNSDAVKFGVNGGAGLNFMLTENLAAFAEVKYVFGSWDGWAITGGFYF